MSEKIQKASLNTSKEDSPNHNDLTGGYQDHVDYEKSKANIYTVYSDDETRRITPTEKDGFLAHELRTYGRKFGKALDAQKDKYKSEGRKKKSEELDLMKWYNKFKPEAEILQWGNIDTLPEWLPSAEELAMMIDEYNACKVDMLKSDVGGLIPLDCGIHMGEATPHGHNRSVYWTYDADGNMRPGDKKAVMIAAGYQAPDQDLSAFDQIQDEKDRAKAIREYERYNNPSVPFLQECREKWYDILEEHGFMVDREPVEPSRNLAKVKQNIITKHLKNLDNPGDGHPGNPGHPGNGSPMQEIFPDRHLSPKKFKEAKRREASRRAEQDARDYRDELMAEAEQEALNFKENAKKDTLEIAKRVVAKARENAKTEAQKIHDSIVAEAEQQASDIIADAAVTAREIKTNAKKLEDYASGRAVSRFKAKTRNPDGKGISDAITQEKDRKGAITAHIRGNLAEETLTKPKDPEQDEVKPVSANDLLKHFGD